MRRLPRTRAAHATDRIASGRAVESFSKSHARGTTRLQSFAGTDSARAAPMQAGSSAMWLGGVQQYGNWSHMNALDVAIGTPLTANFTAVPPDGTGALYRNFSGGVALVNPALQTAHVDVGPGGPPLSSPAPPIPPGLIFEILYANYM